MSVLGNVAGFPSHNGRSRSRREVARQTRFLTSHQIVFRSRAVSHSSPEVLAQSSLLFVFPASMRDLPAPFRGGMATVQQVDKAQGERPGTLPGLRPVAAGSVSREEFLPGTLCTIYGTFTE